jgi:hypothetical protein
MSVFASPMMRGALRPLSGSVSARTPGSARKSRRKRGSAVVKVS